MGNSTSRVVGCFVPSSGNHAGGGKDLEFLEPLDEGLGHSFCYVRPGMLDSPSITPSNSERFTLDSTTIDSETLSGSFRQEIVDDMSSVFQRSNKTYPETTFKTISGASVSANASTARTGNQNAFFACDAQEPAASFESTSSFAAIPLQPFPRGSGSLNGFMSGPLERGYASGPLERGTGIMSGPMEKGSFMSGPLDSTDNANFSAPLTYTRKRPGLTRLMRSVSGPVKGALTRTFSRQSMRPGWMQRFLLHQFVWRPKELKIPQEVPHNCLETGVPGEEYRNACNLQWAHGKAGEDRVHVVLSEEQGWLFVGIYDGFSGPDAPDFLMSHLYRAIDKELEGLLWDYEDIDVAKQSESTILDNTSGISGHQQVVQDSQQCPRDSSGVLEPLDVGTRTEVYCPEIMEVKDEARVSNELYGTSINDEYQTTNPGNINTEIWSAPIASLTGQGKKSKRLYELLNMDDWRVQDNSLEKGNLRMSSCDMQSSSDGFCSSELLSDAQSISYLERSMGASSSCSVEDVNINRGDGRGGGMKSKNGIMNSFDAESTRRFFGSKVRKMYRKQKSLRKKLFPWNYDWHREVTHANEKLVESLGPTRKCKTGIIDHDAVLRAMSQALRTTEEGYLEMVETMLDINPELALMGSCVLVMLMKDQDVYVMNLGDSRVILAQERPNDRHSNPKVLTEDSRHQNRSRESLVRMELDRISEESPMHNHMGQVNKISKNREISLWRLRMRAIQLSTDHSTDVKEEVARIKLEHSDDNQAILNNRVKGQLKVTRAFGAEFLKKPRLNEALLEMFRIDYVGTSAYISCTPSIIHHRLCSNDRFLVLSSDGLYQYFSNEEVVCHVAWFMDNVPEGDPAQYLISELLFRAAKKNGMDFHELLDIPQGDRRKYHDDVSVMVVSLEGRIWRSSG